MLRRSRDAAGSQVGMIFPTLESPLLRYHGTAPLSRHSSIITTQHHYHDTAQLHYHDTTQLSRFSSTITSQLHYHVTAPLSRHSSTITIQLQYHDSTQVTTQVSTQVVCVCSPEREEQRGTGPCLPFPWCLTVGLMLWVRLVFSFSLQNRYEYES